MSAKFVAGDGCPSLCRLVAEVDKYMQSSRTLTEAQSHLFECLLGDIKYTGSEKELQTAHMLLDWVRIRSTEAEEVVRKDKELAECRELNQALATQLKTTDAKLMQTRQKAAELQDDLDAEKAKNEADHTTSSRPSSAREFHIPIPNSREKTGRSRGAQSNHAAQPRKWRQNVDERRICDEPEAVKRYPEQWEKTGRTKVKQKVELVVKEFVIEYISQEYRNIRTGERIYSSFPEDVGKDEVNYGPVYKSILLFLTHECCVPGRKVCQFLHEVSGGTAAVSHGMVAQLARKFSALTQKKRSEIREIARKAAMAHADTTMIRVNGSSTAFNLMLTEDAAFYLATPHKGLEAWDQMPTNGFMGTIISDGETTFLHYGEDRQLCLAHIIRELHGAVQKEPYRTWHAAMETLLKRLVHDRKHGLDRAADNHGNETVRSEWIDEAVREYEEICKLGLSQYGDAKDLNKTSQAGKALLNRLIRRQSDVLRFLTDPSIPYHNNSCERGLRPAKRKYKSMVTGRSFESAEDYANYLTVTRTARLEGNTVFDTLRNVFSS